MAHQRQLIREAVKAQLLGKTAAAARVYETRVVPWKRLELPAVAVYALEETVDRASQSTAPRELRRQLKLAIEVAVKAGTNLDDALDAVALEVERALHADPTFGDTASDSILESTQISLAEEGDTLIGLALLTFSVTYFTMAPEAADVDLVTDFSKAHIATSLGAAVHPDNQAVDDLVVPTT